MEALKRNTFTIKELIYYAYFAIMLITKGFGFYEGQKVYTFALAVSALLIVAKILSTKHDLYEWAVIILLCALGVLIYLNSNEIGALIIIATVVGIKDVPAKRLMAVGFATWTFTFFVRILTTLLHLNGDIFKVQDKFRLGFVIRWSLGQPHPNVLQISFILFCAFVLYFTHFKGKKLYALTVILFLGNLYIFLYSFSITGMMLAIIYLLLNLYLTDLRYRFFKDKALNKVEKGVLIAIFPLAAVFSIAGPLLFKGKLWDFFNKLFNTRFMITKQFMSANPITLFGTGYCNELPLEYNNIDCSYVYALMHYGVIFFVLMLAAFIVLVIYLIKKDKKTELAMTVAFGIAAISEPFFVNPSFKNITWVFIGELLYIGTAKLRKIKELPSFVILKQGEQTTILPEDKIISYVKDLKLTYKKLPRVIFGVALMIGIIAACLFGTFKQMPKAYYMNRRNVQVIDKGFTMTPEEIAEVDGKVLEYTDSDTPMYRIDGMAVTMEFIRAIASLFVWGFVISACLLGVIMKRLIRNESVTGLEDDEEAPEPEEETPGSEDEETPEPGEEII
ncbi:MAG: hypothetical protein K5888_08185 [Lachnospiraceae bacterium]|nr:hypothetical protein [Lachnospiraceae bacterium]